MENSFLEQIANYIAKGLSGVEKIESIEENAGSLWVKTKDGKTHSVSVFETENEEEL